MGADGAGGPAALMATMRPIANVLSVLWAREVESTWSDSEALVARPLKACGLGKRGRGPPALLVDFGVARFLDA